MKCRIPFAKHLDQELRARVKFTYRDGLSPQYDEALRSLHHESRELVTKNTFYFIGLLDLDAHADRVD